MYSNTNTHSLGIIHKFAMPSTGGKGVFSEQVYWSQESCNMEDNIYVLQVECGPMHWPKVTIILTLAIRSPSKFPQLCMMCLK